ncbi:MAG: glycosyltransferase family 39 protein [Thermoleophilia bacterium]
MKKSPARILLLIFAISVAVRLLAVSTRAMITVDEVSYARLAESLADGRGMVDIMGMNVGHFSPLLPLLMAGLSFLLHDVVRSGYVVVVFFGSLITVPTYLLGRELFSEKVGLGAAALMAVIPLFVDYSSRLYSESVFIFFLMMTLYFAWKMLNRPGIFSAVMAGLCLGVFYLGSPSAVFYFLMIAVLALGMGLRQRSLKSVAKPLALFLLAFLIFAVPYVVFLHSVTGGWTYTGKKADEQIFTATHHLRYGTVKWEKEALTLTADGRATWVERTSNKQDLISFFIHEPRVAAGVFVSQTNILYTELLAKIMPLWLLPLAGLGLFAGAWDKRRALAMGYLLVMMTPVLVILAMYVTDRFFLPFLPLGLILVSLGWMRLNEWAYDTVTQCFQGSIRDRLLRLAPWIIGAGVLLPVFGFAVANVVRQEYETQYREAGEWFRADIGPDKRIMNLWETSSAYYAGGVAVIVPYADYDQMTAYAAANDVDYLMVGRQSLADLRPELARVLAAPTGHPQWKLVHAISPGTYREVMIFQRVTG